MERDWIALLRALDETGIEYPDDFDVAAVQARVDRLAARLSGEFEFPLTSPRGPEQDAAFFGSIRIPSEATGIRTKRSRVDVPLMVRVSNFGFLATYDVPAGAPIPSGVQARVERALSDEGFPLVPVEVLAAPYEGPNDWIDTWGIRFFSWL